MAATKVKQSELGTAAIKLVASGNTGLTTGNATIALATTGFSKGTGLTKSGNTILVGKGVNYVRVTAAFTAESFSMTSTYVFALLQKNSSVIGQGLMPSTLGFAFFPMTAEIDVVEGDTISMVANVGSGTATCSGATRHVYLFAEATG